MCGDDGEVVVVCLKAGEAGLYQLACDRNRMVWLKVEGFIDVGENRCWRVEPLIFGIYLSCNRDIV